MSPAAVITAAGLGARFGALTRHNNKCLQKVSDTPLLSGIIDKLAAAGLVPIHVICGHAAEKVEAEIAGRAAVLFNPDYRETGILASLLVAEERLAGRPFLFTTGDHYFHTDALRTCLAPTAGVRVLIEEREALNAEDAKVIHGPGGVRRFGKDIPLAEATGEFAGMALFSAAASRRFFDRARARVAASRGGYVMDIFNELIEDGALPLDMALCGPGIRMEIDTVSDLTAARAMARRHASKSRASARGEPAGADS